MLTSTWFKLIFAIPLFTVALMISNNGFAVDELLSGDNEQIITNDEKKPKDIERSAVAQRHFDQIEEILDREEFGRTEYVKAWRLIGSEDKEARKEKFPEWLIKFLEWLEEGETSKKDNSSTSSFNWALILEVILWGLAIGLVLFILIKYREKISALNGLFRGSEREKQLPTTMFGLDIKKESLPDDIVVSAQQHWENKEPRLAIAMLLRASLINLLNDHDCRFYDSDTEAECCLRIDKQVEQSLSGYMHRLVSIWQQIAYAHRVPSNTEFERLCFQWNEVFS